MLGSLGHLGSLTCGKVHIVIYPLVRGKFSCSKSTDLLPNPAVTEQICHLGSGIYQYVIAGAPAAQGRKIEASLGGQATQRTPASVLLWLLIFRVTGGRYGPSKRNGAAKNGTRKQAQPLARAFLRRRLWVSDRGHLPWPGTHPKRVACVDSRSLRGRLRGGRTGF
jgi:hypothetical protein